MSKHSYEPSTKTPGDHRVTPPLGTECEKCEFEVAFLHAATHKDFADTLAEINKLSEKQRLQDLPASNSIVSGEAKHFVNLPREEIWQDLERQGDADTFRFDRMGQMVRVVVRFKKKEKREVKVELLDAGQGGNIYYTKEEQERNSNFIQVLTHEGFTDANGILIVELRISPAGGNRYKVRATDIITKCTEDSKGTLEVWRYLWAQRVHLGANNPAFPTAKVDLAVSMIEQEYGNRFVLINTWSMPTQSSNKGELLDINDYSGIKSIVKEAIAKAQDYEKKKRFTFVVAITRNITEFKLDRQVAYAVKTGFGALPVYIYVEDKLIAAYKDENRQDVNYLLSAEYDGKEVIDGVKIRDLCKCYGMSGDSISTTASSTPYFLGSCIEVNVSQIPAKYSGKNLRLKFKTVTGTEAAGVTWSEFKLFAFGMVNTNLCIVGCESHDYAGPKIYDGKAIYKRTHEQSEQSIASIYIHEVGHALGQACSGKGKLPDKTEYYYPTTKNSPDPLIANHRGPHCKRGYTAGSGGASCVMFGSLTPNVISFCVDGDGSKPVQDRKDCNNALRKVEIYEPWESI